MEGVVVPDGAGIQPEDPSEGGDATRRNAPYASPRDAAKATARPPATTAPATRPRIVGCQDRVPATAWVADPRAAAQAVAPTTSAREHAPAHEDRAAPAAASAHSAGEGQRAAREQRIEVPGVERGAGRRARARGDRR